MKQAATSSSTASAQMWLPAMWALTQRDARRAVGAQAEFCPAAPMTRPWCARRAASHCASACPGASGRTAIASSLQTSIPQLSQWCCTGVGLAISCIEGSGRIAIALSLPTNNPHLSQWCCARLGSAISCTGASGRTAIAGIPEHQCPASCHDEALSGCAWWSCPEGCCQGAIASSLQISGS